MRLSTALWVAARGTWKRNAVPSQVWHKVFMHLSLEARWLMLPVILALGLGPSLAAAEPRGLLKGTILDDDTGKPTACTVQVIDRSGKPIVDNPSFGSGFRALGEFKTSVQAGEVLVRVTRGFETRAEEQRVSVSPGSTTEIAFRLHRLVDLREKGWYSGDSHAHMIHGERTIPVSFDFVALTARAEDLQYLSLSHAWNIESPTPEKLDAELGARSVPECQLTWNLEAPKNFYKGDARRCLGHSWTLGMKGRTSKGANVIDLLLAASALDYETEKPTFGNFESHQLIRVQSGTIFYSHPARWWTGKWGGRSGFPEQQNTRISNLAAELPLDLLLGPSFDGVDVITGPREFEANAMAFELWSMLLNKGYRLAATASSDACFDRVNGAIPGVVRTYTYLPDGFSIPNVAKAMAEGRNFVTSGPLLVVSLDGQPPGSSLPADGTPRFLRIEGWASGKDPEGLSRLELLRNGRVVGSHKVSAGSNYLEMSLRLLEHESAWYCVRLFGSNPQKERAISGAFFLDVEPHRPAAPISARVQVKLIDQSTGQKLPGGLVREVLFLGPDANPGKSHHVPGGEATLYVPANLRLQAEMPGYRAQTKSIFLEHTPLIKFITGLSAEDLVNWETYERVRAMLNEVSLTFELERL